MGRVSKNEKPLGDFVWIFLCLSLHCESQFNNTRGFIQKEIIACSHGNMVGFTML
jgi:hypothetical protein